jgi:nucleotide-binding universal stress UspA family protein
MTLDAIVVGTDFSEQSRAALDWAIDLARTIGSVRLILVHVYDLPLVGFPDAALMVDASTAARISDAAQASLNAEVARGSDRGVALESLLRQGDPSDVLPFLAVAEKAGLIVVGSHGRRGLARALLGSVAESVLRSSNTPVVVVPVHDS